MRRLIRSGEVGVMDAMAAVAMNQEVLSPCLDDILTGSRIYQRLSGYSPAALYHYAGVQPDMLIGRSAYCEVHCYTAVGFKEFYGADSATITDVYIATTISGSHQSDDVTGIGLCRYYGDDDMLNSFLKY